VFSSSTFTNAVGGVLSADGGTLSLAAAWSNAGQIVVNNSTLNLGGSFTTDGLGSYTRTGGTINLTGLLRVRVGTETIPTDYFLEDPAVLGRTFTLAEDRPNAEPVIVLGYGLWRRAFGGDSRILGRRIDVDGNPLGIAVSGLTRTTMGQWQYSVNGTTWLSIGTVSATSAFLLASSDYIRFVPNAGFIGSAFVAQYPQGGGNFWVPLQYLLGLRERHAHRDAHPEDLRGFKPSFHVVDEIPVIKGLDPHIREEVVPLGIHCIGEHVEIKFKQSRIDAVYRYAKLDVLFKVGAVCSFKTRFSSAHLHRFAVKHIAQKPRCYCGIVGLDLDFAAGCHNKGLINLMLFNPFVEVH
jgi:hypothetical protein